MTPEMETAPTAVGSSDREGGIKTTHAHENRESSTSNRGLGGCGGRNSHQGCGGIGGQFNRPAYISSIRKFK